MEIPTASVATMYETALTIRLFEQRAIEQYRVGNIRGYLHPYLGEEGIAVGACAALRPSDYIVSTHRGHGHAIAKGHEPRLMMAELLGRATGYCRGRGGSMHVSSLALRNLGANGVVAGGMPLAVGAAFAIRLKGETDIVVSFCSDGASANGAFHEALNLAAIYHLPVVFVLENNHYAVSTPIRDSALVEDLSERAAGYGMPGVTVDGNDAIAGAGRDDHGRRPGQGGRRADAHRVQDLSARRPPRQRSGAVPAKGGARSLAGA